MKKEMSELERKKLLKKSHHQKIDYALAKAFVNDSDVYKLVKDFFAEYLNLDYEFTHEELNRELSKMFIEENLKKNISMFLSKLSYMQFNSVNRPSQDQLREMIKQFKEIISSLIVFEESKKKGFLGKIAEFFSSHKKTKKSGKAKDAQKKELQEPDKEHDKLPELEKGFEELQKTSQQNDPVLITNQTTYEVEMPEKKLSSIIISVQQKIKNNNFAEARQDYRKLLEKYNSLPEHEKHQYFLKVNQLYSQLSKK